MPSVIVIITAVLMMSILPSIEMRLDHCYKKTITDLVNCPEPPTKTCTNWAISNVAEGRSVGSIGSLTCSADHSLYGNDTIQCLESGVWSQINMINAICVPNDISSAVFHSFKNSNYLSVGDQKNYPDAQTSCSYVCGSLVEINTEEENNFIGSTVDEAWIGLHSKDGKQFEWPSGNTTTSNLYESWGNQQINDLFIGNCVRLTSGQYWIDMLV